MNGAAIQKGHCNVKRTESHPGHANLSAGSARGGALVAGKCVFKQHRLMSYLETLELLEVPYHPWLL